MTKRSFVLWARQYSKRILSALFIVWVVGALAGLVYEFLRLIYAPDTADMQAFYIYLATPLTCGIPSYLISNNVLNIEKVKQQYDPDYDDRFMDNPERGEGFGLDSEKNTEELSADRFYADSKTFSEK